MRAFFRVPCARVGKLLLCCWLVFFGAVSAWGASPGAASADRESEATKREIKLGRQAVSEVEKHMSRVMDPAANARLSVVVKRLEPFMERELDYEIRVVDVKDPNAFSLPGGMMYITTGMLDFIKSESELAGIIAHEMVHADRKHVLIQVARNERMTLPALAVVIASAGAGAVVPALILTNMAQVAVMNAYSRDLEREADYRGIDALVRAGYEPSGMVTMLERLEEEQLKRPYVDPGVYQSHPETRERISNMVSYMKQHDIPMRRKIALGILRTGIAPASDDRRLRLTIDDALVCEGDRNPATERFLEELKEKLDRAFQLETLGYDIALRETQNGQTIYLSGSLLVAQSSLPPHVTSVEAIRANLVRIQELARRSHPIANYLL